MAINRNVATATQNQAFNAILFLYKDVLHISIDAELQAVRAKKPKRLPTVLSQAEMKRFLERAHGTHGLMLKLLYGSGLRLMEVVRLRVHDVDFDNSMIMVRDTKGNKDRSTLLPAPLIDSLKDQLKVVKTIFETDLANGDANVYLPGALAR